MFHQERRGDERQRRATLIQRVFRGWRTRKRLVWQVRDDVRALVAGIEGDLESSWALLGPDGGSSPFALEWGDGNLRLPRMQDVVFGLKVDFPLALDEDDRANMAGAHVETIFATEDTIASNHNGSSSASADQFSHEAVSERSSAALDLSEAMENCTPTGSPGAKSSASFGSNSDLESNSSVDATSSVQGSDVACTSRVSRATDAATRASGVTSSTHTGLGGVMKPSSVETRPAPQAETSADLSLAAAPQAEEFASDEAASPLPLSLPLPSPSRTRNKDGDRLAHVQELLATYSRDEILLELQWARQALRDRRKYLRSKPRVEKESAQLACA